MFFLRIIVLLIVGLGAAVYLISMKIKEEVLRAGRTSNPLFRDQRAQFKAFCNNPPTNYALRLITLKRNLSKALIVAFLALLITILSVIYEQSVKTANNAKNLKAHSTALS